MISQEECKIPVVTVDWNYNAKVQFMGWISYSDGYILVKGNITITGEGNDIAARQADE